MRAERRKEIEQQMRGEHVEKKPAKNGLFTVIALVYIAACAAFLYYVFKLNVLPTAYLIAGIAVIAVISLFTLPVMISRRGKRERKIAAAIISLIFIALFGITTYYLSTTSTFLDKITEKKVVTEDFHVLVRAEDMPQELEAAAQAALAEGEEGEDADAASAAKLSEKEIEEIAFAKITGTVIGTYNTNDQMYSKAKVMLQEKVPVDYAYDEVPATTVEYLLNGTHNAILLPAASYEALQSEGVYDLDTNTRILYTLKVPKETIDRTKAVNVTKEAFNIFISGADEGGMRTDVNMVATVNPVTHKVHLTSIPRDFYVTLPSKEAKDKLTHSSIYGIDETVSAVENELGISINYYVKVNYESLKGVVDAIGGIDVESEHDFTTSGMGKLNGHHFVVGTNHLDGPAALAFCRERHSFMEGDMTRNENQQAVLKAILKKATSSKEILKSYTSILDAVSGNLETDMSADEMAQLVKMQLSKMPEWEISNSAIKGATGSDYCYSLGRNASVVYPQPDEITKAVEEIVKTEMME